VKPIRIDFKRRVMPAPWLWWFLGLVAFAAVAAGWTAWQSWRQVEMKRAALREATTVKLAAPAPVLRPPVAYESSAREMLAEHNSPWPQAMTAIEATAIVGVTPVAVEFVASERTVRVELNFADYAKLLEYVEALNAGDAELKWSLLQSQAQPGTGATAIIVGSLGRR
jgi:hypothetical protein